MIAVSLRRPVIEALVADGQGEIVTAMCGDQSDLVALHDITRGEVVAVASLDVTNPGNTPHPEGGRPVVTWRFANVRRLGEPVRARAPGMVDGLWPLLPRAPQAAAAVLSQVDAMNGVTP